MPIVPISLPSQITVLRFLGCSYECICFAGAKSSDLCLILSAKVASISRSSKYSFSTLLVLLKSVTASILCSSTSPSSLSPFATLPISNTPKSVLYEVLYLTWQSCVGIIELRIVSIFGFVALTSLILSSTSIPKALYSS